MRRFKAALTTGAAAASVTVRVAAVATGPPATKL
jgi:hypothetical protein